MLPVSVDCPFFIAPSVFSKRLFIKAKQYQKAKKKPTKYKYILINANE
jgi:hypothetical protein